MTNQEAITILRKLNKDTDYSNKEVYTAINLAVNALYLSKCEECGYKIGLNKINKLNSCNNCKKFIEGCPDRPKWGGYARINCKDWMGYE